MKIVEDLFYEKISDLNTTLDKNLPLGVLKIKTEMFGLEEKLLNLHNEALDELNIDPLTKNPEKIKILEILEENYIDCLIKELKNFSNRLIRITKKSWK